MDVTTAMLADAAALADGKLYVHGGGWDNIYTAEVPTTHPALALVLIFHLSWHEANEDIPLRLELVDEDDRHPVTRGEGKMRTGTPPQVKKGADLYYPFAQMFYGLQFPKLGRYVFRVASGGQVLASLPLTVSTPP